VANAADGRSSTARLFAIGIPRAQLRVGNFMRVHVVVGDLLDQPVDAIVNAWNRNIIPWWLLLPQGVSGAIKRRAGLAPFRELGRMGSIPLGGAVVTTAGRLPHRAIIHVAGINMFWRATEKSIRDSIRSAVDLCIEHELRSVAFPVIGAGSGGFDETRALRIVTEQLAHTPGDVDATIVQFQPRSASTRNPDESPSICVRLNQ
jgi:O-acetyl-ADP-ribose deacetylase